MDQQPVTFRIPPELKERLRRVAFDKRVPMNTIATEGIEARVAQLESEAPEPTT